MEKGLQVASLKRQSLLKNESVDLVLEQINT